MAENVKQKTGKPKPVELFALGSEVQSTIVLSNPGNDTLKLRSINITGTKLRDVSGEILKQVSFSARLRPGQVEKFPLEFEIDPTTPPGTYKGKFECGDVLQQPFILHILENIELSILPSRLFIHGVPGQHLSKEIVISNQSNVPIHLDREMSIVMCEINELNQAIESSLRESIADGYISMMDDLVARLKETMVTPISLKLDNENLELQSGETRKFDISLYIPSNFKAGCSYQGETNIYDFELSMLLYCSKEKEVSG